MVVALSLVWMGCAQQETPPELNHPQEQEDAVEDAGPDPVAQLFRASLDLRGVRPTMDEIERVDADPQAYGELVDEFLDDPRFEERVINMYAEVFLTRSDGLKRQAHARVWAKITDGVLTDLWVQALCPVVNITVAQAAEMKGRTFISLVDL